MYHTGVVQKDRKQSRVLFEWVNIYKLLNYMFVIK